MARRLRLDAILIERGIVKDKGEAFVVVTEGRVLADGQRTISPAQIVRPDAKIEIRGGAQYVGRGAYKLEAGLGAFHIDPAGKICADIGSATGGFTEVLLKLDAKKVYAIDTARGKLALRIREDPRVVVMEGTDVRDLEVLPEPADLAVIDVSLITLREILPAVRRLLRPEGVVVALFKPQYETRDPRLLYHGVIREAADREALLNDFMGWLEANGWVIRDRIESPIRGSKGNLEYLFLLQPNI